MLIKRNTGLLLICQVACGWVNVGVLLMVAQYNKPDSKSQMYHNIIHVVIIEIASQASTGYQLTEVTDANVYSVCETLVALTFWPWCNLTVSSHIGKHVCICCTHIIKRWKVHCLPSIYSKPFECGRAVGMIL